MKIDTIVGMAVLFYSSDGAFEQEKFDLCWARWAKEVVFWYAIFGLRGEAMWKLWNCMTTAAYATFLFDFKKRQGVLVRYIVLEKGP